MKNADERSLQADERSGGGGQVVPAAGGGGVAFAAGAVAQDRETGRFASGGGLTKMQAAFVRAYVRNGGNATAAAREAGYSQDRHGTGWELTRNPAVMSAIRVELARRVMGEGTAIGLDTLIEVAQDKGQSGSARVAAATRLVDMGGFLPKHGQGGAGKEAEQKAPSEMSVTELDQVAAGLLEAMTRAKIAAAGGDPGAVTLNISRNDGDQDAQGQ